MIHMHMFLKAGYVDKVFGIFLSYFVAAGNKPSC